MPFIYINNKTNSSTPITTTPKDYFMSLMKNPLYTTINVNIKDIKFHITLDFTFLIVLKKLFLENDPEAAEIKEDEDLYSLEYIGIYRAKYTNNSFSFKLNDTQDITLSNYSFFMVKEMMNEYDYAIRTKYLATENEEIGFNVLKGNKIEKVEVEEDDEDYDPYYPYYQYNPYVKEEEKIDYLNNKNNDERKVGEKYVNKNNGYLVEENTNIITQLKKQKIISSYTFCIKYDNKNEEKGKIIIGGMPHEYDPRHFSERYFIYHTTIMGNGYGNWGINFDDIKYNGESLPHVKAAEITIDFGFILSTETYKYYFDKKFFLESNITDFCKEEQVNIYIFKYCEKR